MALQDIEKELNDIHVTRTELSRREATKYYEKILRDLDARRVDASLSQYQGTWVDYVPVLGTGAKALRILSSASKFYWHTSKYNMSKLSTLKFKKRISYRGHQTVRKPMPVNLCLFYNAEKRAYDRCTRAQEEIAENPVEAAKLASNSPECKDVESIIDCMNKRRQTAPELRPDKEEKITDNLLELE